MIHGPGAELVGSDSLGNKYYERNTEHYGAPCATAAAQPLPAVLASSVVLLEAHFGSHHT